MKDIAIFGAGGFGKEIACIIKRINKLSPSWNLIGFFDDGIPSGTETSYGRVIGDTACLNSYNKRLAIVLAIGSPEAITKIVGRITNPLIEFPNIIDPDVIFLDEDNVKLGKGNVILMKCTISCNVVIGNFNLFNIGVGIGHDVTMGNCNVFMPNVNISGGVEIENSNLFGVKSSIVQYMKVGNHTKIGAHCLMLRKAKSNSLYFGLPGEKIL